MGSASSAIVFGFDDVFADGVEAEPESSGSSGSYNDFQLVGHGSVANEFCGRRMKLKACLNVEAHDITTLDGVNHRGQVYYRVFSIFVTLHHVPCASSMVGLFVWLAKLRLV